MSTNKAFNPDHLITRTEPGNISVELIGQLSPESEPSGAINLQVTPKVANDCIHLVGNLEAELSDAIKYKLQIVAYWFLDQDALPTEEQLREFILHRGIFDLIAVMNHELRGLGIQYGYPYPAFGGPEIETLRAEILEESPDAFKIPST